MDVSFAKGDSNRRAVEVCREVQRLRGVLETVFALFWDEWRCRTSRALVAAE
jgi:hypothetical protein